MAIRGSELKQNWAWYRDHILDDEPVVFPRKEAQKRAKTKEKRHRISFAVDEQTYRDWQPERERIMQAMDENPTLFGLWLIDVLRSWQAEQLAGWKKAREEEEWT